MDNPVKINLQKKYEKLTDKQRCLLEAYGDLPKEEKYFIPIKRRRQPNVQVGDIFAVQLADKKFCYGKVIAPAAKLPRIQEGFFSVMMSNIVTNTLDEVTFELNESSILLPPWIVNKTFWRNGTFFTIS